MALPPLSPLVTLLFFDLASIQPLFEQNETSYSQSSSVNLCVSVPMFVRERVLPTEFHLQYLR